MSSSPHAEDDDGCRTSSSSVMWHMQSDRSDAAEAAKLPVAANLLAVA
jgi:hypothetical protein